MTADNFTSVLEGLRGRKPFTATGATIEPLPFRSMSTYPYGPEEHYPRDTFHEDYRKRFNTRLIRAVSGRN